MKNKILFVIAFLGILAGGSSAYLLSREKPAQPPVFNPASNPYSEGIFANGILESDQPSGENTNIYPEVSGTVKQILVAEGQSVKKGQPLLLIDDSIQRATAEQLQSQAAAAKTMLEELKAQPRLENLQVAESQLEATQANLKTAQDTLDKQRIAYELNPRSVSKDALDGAINAAAVGKANVDVAQKQYDLMKAGAWSYDIKNQQSTYNALNKAYMSSQALLSKYTLCAARDGVVLSINASLGSFVSPTGVYDPYTQGQAPLLALGGPQSTLNVRCYVDEILVSRIPPASTMKAQMSIRGTDVKVPLTFVRVQPLVSPKIALSDAKLERVDLRVLPIIFRVDNAKDLKIFPGQLVDVYIGE